MRGQPMDVRAPSGRECTHLPQRDTQQMDDLGARRLPGEKEHVHPGVEVCLEFHVTVEDPLIPAEYGPALTSHDR